MWAGVADRWAEYADYIEERGQAVTAALLDCAALAPGDRVLELACGPGGAGLAAARRVAPTGSVVLSDVAPEMVAVAQARAAQLGIDNVAFATLDVEHIDQPDDEYDALICREGLMFAVDPDRAARQLRRVLRPGGRLAVAVWAERERNPWLGLVFDAVTAVTGLPVPPPGVPGPFSLADPGRLSDPLRAAGFADVTLDEVAAPVRAPSFDAWWARTTNLAGPIASILASLPTETSDAITVRVREAVAPYISSAGLELPGLTLVGAGRA
jgi:SAM-dependent methyltransferase